MRRKTEAAELAGTPVDWRPTASIASLRRRAAVARAVREYFAAAGVLEVQVPAIMPWGATDPALASFTVLPADGSSAPCGYLQTSPEFAMKRLLAAGSGDIYHLGPAFRAEESGRHHLAEFTLLEWYRVGMDHHDLMDDVQALVSGVRPGLRFERRSCADVFGRCYSLDPHTATVDELARAARAAGIELGPAGDDRRVLLDALYAHSMLRTDPGESATFVFDFPREHAAYARIDARNPAIASRFELVVDGLELANGYFELTDPLVQAERMREENARRRAANLPPMEPDPALLAALDSGLPSCAGVALGFDRLVMLATGEPDIALVTAFA